MGPNPRHACPPLPAAMVRRRGRPCFIVRDANGQASPTSISRRSRDAGGGQNSSPATRPGASPPTSPSCRSCLRSRETPETTSGLSDPARAFARRLSAKLTGGTAGKPPWTSALNLPGRRSRACGRRPGRDPRGSVRRSRRLRGGLPGAGNEQAHEDKAAHACAHYAALALAEELQRRRGTRILALSIIDRQQER